MAVEIKMPQMGESITEGTVVRWFVKPGDRIERDAPLLEISTDKVDTEIPSPAGGYVVELLVAEGETVPVDTPLCVLGDEKPAEGAARAAGEPPRGAPAAPGESAPAAPRVEAAAAPPAEPPAREDRERAERLSPAVRRLVREHGIDISTVRGTGEGGRVTRNDVLAYVESSRAPAAPRAAPAPAEAGLAFGERFEPMSIMRRKIAEHMVLSKKTSAHVSTVHEVDFTGVVRLRERLRPDFDRRGIRLTYLPFLAQAVAQSLLRFPVLNASIEGDTVHYKGSVHLGLAVALEDGLIVPVLSSAEKLSIVEIARGIEDLAGRARRKALRPEEVQNGTFTITNPGVFGTLIGTPIIPQPQVAILCFGAVQKRAVVLPESDSIAVRSMAYLTMTFDHRLIDGATADRFLQSVRTMVETHEFRVEP